jgi:hypothetical protein
MKRPKFVKRGGQVKDVMASPPPQPRTTWPDPPPAEVIPDLDWIEFTRGSHGAAYSEKRQERERAKIAADLTARGEPFVWHGVRHPNLPVGSPQRWAKAGNE